MMRPITCLSLIAALGAGGYLYQEKHTAQLLDRDINKTMKQADQARDRIGLLKAEWALLNEPERLQTLAAQHLPTLQSLQPTQFARLEDLPSRLPAVSAAPVATAPVVDTPVAQVQLVAPIPARAPAMLAQATAIQAPVAPVAMLAAAPIAAPPPPAPVAQQAPARAVERPVQLAAARPKPAPHVLAAKPREPEPMVAAAPAPRPYYAPVMPAYAPTPYAIHAPTLQTASAMVQPQPAPFVGSALGMARSMLAAPVPVASNASMGYSNGR